MAAMGTYMFGKASNFRYIFPEDLTRYQLARLKWEKTVPDAKELWWLKQQQETFTQCVANFSLLCLPVGISVAAATAKVPGSYDGVFKTMQLMGVACWIFSYAFENGGDLQKEAFLQACRKANKELKECASENADVAEQITDKIKKAVLGHSVVDMTALNLGKLDGKKYFLWRWCRHPNYFGEWCCWLSLSFATLPSLLRLLLATTVSEGRKNSSSVPQLVAQESVVTVAFTALLLLLSSAVVYMIPRVFYDCLVHWTGAGPAEHFSAPKRPEYKEYQKQVRCFFPFELPSVDHHRERGWPNNEEQWQLAAKKKS
eukprot:TRINITY_DN609_c4_g1_i1.p1 TRINITY_DN609_c4_g1~~TRINITY_DN609_c4_g1_i1.p1  ORF type:complete len:366 (+),score=48.64 TRINITY_DN609_c4_g1_i1:156-1100(+)